MIFFSLPLNIVLLEVIVCLALKENVLKEIVQLIHEGKRLLYNTQNILCCEGC